MILSLLLLAADPETAVDAERAFNRAAQSGQWAAFRKFMADDAVVFTPQPEKAKDALPTKEPPVALQWWPADSYVSCDGNLAVNTGPWVGPKGFGYFTTVWRRQPDGRFKWVMDGGDDLAKPLPRPTQPRVHKASCAGIVYDVIARTQEPNIKQAKGESRDGTLFYTWTVRADGSRTFSVRLWNGKDRAEVLRQQIAAPK